MKLGFRLYTGGYTWVNTEAQTYYDTLVTKGFSGSLYSISEYTAKVNIDIYFTALKSVGLSKIVSNWIFLGTNGFNQSEDCLLNNQLTFYNSPTYSTSGCVFNGSSQYADTGILASSLTTNSVGLGGSFTGISATGTNRAMIGADNGSGSALELFNNSSTYWVNHCHSSIDKVTNPNTGDYNKYILGSRVSSTDLRINVDGVYKALYSTAVSSTPPALNLFIASTNLSSVASKFLGGTAKGIIVHNGVTTAESLILKNALTTLNTAFGR